MRSLTIFARKAGVEVEGVDRHHNADVVRRREGNVGEDTLQTAGLLQNQRPVALGQHDDPADAHRIHVAEFVHAEHRVEAVSPEISGVVDQPLCGAFCAETVEMPLQPAQDIAGRGIRPPEPKMTDPVGTWAGGRRRNRGPASFAPCSRPKA